MKTKLVTILAVLGFWCLASAAWAEPETSTLRALRAYPVYTGDREEPAAERLARLTEVAAAIDAATSNPIERALLLAVGWHESRWAAYVQLDAAKCREGQGGKCDGGRAWGLWQLHRTDRRGGAAAMAELAVRRLRGGVRQCGGKTLDERVRGAVSLFATGSRCEWSGAGERVASFRSALRRLSP